MAVATIIGVLRARALDDAPAGSGYPVTFSQALRALAPVEG